jgi:hypothetical protein
VRDERDDPLSSSPRSCSAISMVAAS